jgi:2-polyprenyl-3-methyl-5-hydroxy-6-metoxy-1,4-benzoquinol methylase
MATDVTVLAAPVLHGLDAASVPAEGWEELTACGACGESGGLRDVIVVSGASEPGTAVSACARCEHVQLRRRPTQDWFDEYYASQWDARGRDSEQTRTPVSDKVASFCAPHLPEGARVLDVGAGFGSQLLGFRGLGFEVYGLERSDHRAKHIEALGIPCSFGPFERAELPSELDLVFSHHVLEHVGDPELVLRRCAGAVREGGLVYVAVPNLWHEHAVQTAHFVPHLSTFSERSLDTLMARCGLRVIERRVDRELQLLARREPADGPAVAAHADFDGALATWLAEGFGAAEGERLLVWWKSPDKRTLYARDTRAARSARTLALTDRLEGRLPAAGRSLRARMWPAAAARTARSVVVSASGDGLPPIAVRHPQARAVVWIK